MMDDQVTQYEWERCWFVDMMRLVDGLARPTERGFIVFDPDGIIPGGAYLGRECVASDVSLGEAYPTEAFCREAEITYSPRAWGSRRIVS